MYCPVEPLSIHQYIQSLLDAASIKLDAPNNDRFIRKPEVLLMTGLSKDPLERRIKAGTFPKPYKVGNHYRMWSMIEVQQWLESQKVVTDK